MKRKRLILTAVLLACVSAMVVPNWERLWLAVAYERVSMEPRMTGRKKVLAKGMVLLEKRWRYLPTPPRIVPPQLCGGCRSGHQICYNGTLPDAFVIPGNRNDEWRCTCRDPIHEWNR